MAALDEKWDKTLQGFSGGLGPTSALVNETTRLAERVTANQAKREDQCKAIAAAPPTASVASSGSAAVHGGPTSAGTAKGSGEYKQLRVSCPEGMEATSARFGCGCHANDGTTTSVDAPKGKDCKDMPGSDGHACIFMCR